MRSRKLRPPDEKAARVRLDQRQRLLIALAIGATVGAVVAFLGSWQLASLAGWDSAALFLAGAIWSFIVVSDATTTEMVATREDDSRAVVDLIVVAASLVSLVGVGLGLAHANNDSGTSATVLTTVSVLTVFLSWFTVHTLFTLRYASLFYGDPVGGIDFANKDEAPDYLDFAYVAFTVGMTFQVSDTDITARVIRRTTFRHSLLSYVFGTVIVGVTINVLGGLVR